jgi:hypothetical protein
LGKLLCLQRYCDLCFHIYKVLNEVGVVPPPVPNVLFGMPVAYVVCSMDVIILTSFKNIVNTKTLITVAWKAQQFHQLSMHLMIAEEAETSSAVTNFKKIEF